MIGDDQQIKVSYTACDILALSGANWRHWATIVGIIAAILVLIPVIFALIDGYPIRDSFAEIDWTFTGVIIVILLGWLLFVSVVGYLWRRVKGFHGPIHFSLTQKGISIRNREMDGVVFWKAIRSIKVHRDRLFLFLSRRSALIVPRRAFENPEQFDAFVNETRQNWLAAQITE